MEKRLLTINQKTKDLIEEKFQFKKELAREKEELLFSVFNEPLSKGEELALKFLYAYMPLNDLADYEGDLFLAHVKKAFSIQKTVPWRDKIPVETFLYFILPYRVNNENFEDFRMILFEEIFPRVKNLSMKEAILETNHWCHEKANYIGNDRRTVSPLTLMRTTLGRCGEQSTLAVAALRSIGIPARQVYTPLWAHSDSNHAWVEAWADGKWYFFGACEPEPRLNQGWFEDPAKRAMLIHTRVYAKYDGPEEITIAHPWYSELNLTNLYADTKTIKIHVQDEAGHPVQAKVQFLLFNFGGIRPILSLETDPSGTTDVTLGLGDVFISAKTDDGFGFAKCNVRQEEEITIVLTDEFPASQQVDFKMVPPIEQPKDPALEISKQEQAAHKQRIKEGVAIRSAYEETFIQEEAAQELADELSLSFERVWEVLKSARGNSHEIANFLKENSPTYGDWCLQLLEVLNEKDLTDTFRPTLAEHLKEAMKLRHKTSEPLKDSLFAKFILCPRVHYEMITPYRSYFQEQLGMEKKQQFLEDPWKLIDYLEKTFEVVKDLNFYQGSATPVGSFQIKKGDALSRDILFVAIARSIGIPARLAPTDRQPQIYQRGQWDNVHFKDTADKDVEESQKVDETGVVHWKLDSSTDEKISYMKNFTIDRFHKGTYEPLFYHVAETGEEELEMPVGKYRLTTSRRLSDGTALITLRYFEVQANEEVTVPVTFPQDTTEVPVIAQSNLQVPLTTATQETIQAADRIGTQGSTFIWLEPDREPSKHLLRELREMKTAWEALDIEVNCFITEEKWQATQELQAAGDLPDNLSFFRETNDFQALEKFGKHLPPTNTLGEQLPVVCVCDENGRIRYTSEGYKLGIANDVINIYKQIES